MNSDCTPRRGKSYENYDYDSRSIDDGSSLASTTSLHSDYKKLARKLNKRRKQLKEELEDTKNSLDSKQKELEKTQDFFQAQISILMDERDSSHRQLQEERKKFREKEEHYQSLFSEKIGSITALTSTNEQLEKKLKNTDNYHTEQIFQIQYDLDRLRTEAQQKYDDAGKIYAKTLQEMRDQYETKFTELKRMHKTQLEHKHEEYNKKLESNAYEIQKQTQTLSMNAKQEQERLQKEITTLRNDLTKLTQESRDRLVKQEEDLRQKFDLAMQKAAIEWESKLIKKEKELNDTKLYQDKNNSEVEETNKALQYQIHQLKENMKKVQQNSQQINDQIIRNFNEQKAIAEQEIFVRDQEIGRLQRDLGNAATEAVMQLTTMDRRMKSAIEELKEMTEKYNSLKAITDKNNDSSIAYLTELKICKENETKLHEKIQTLQNERDMAEKRAYSTEENRQRQESEFIQYKTEVYRLQKLETKLQEEMQKLRESKDRTTIELQQKIEELNNKNIAIDTEKFQSNKIGLRLQQLQERITTLELENNKKEHSIQSYKNEAERSKQDATRINAELTTLRMQFAKELEQKISLTKEEKDRIILESSQRATRIEKMYEACVKENDWLKKSLTDISDEKSHLTQKLNFYTQPENDYKAKLERIQILETEISSMKLQFAATMQNSQKEISCKEQENLILQRKAKQLDEKDIYIQDLSLKLSSAQKSFDANLKSMIESHKKEKEELEVLKAKSSVFKDQSEELEKLRKELFALKQSTDEILVEKDHESKTEILKLRKEIHNAEMKAFAEKAKEIDQLKCDLMAVRSLYENKMLQLDTANKEEIMKIRKDLNEAQIKAAQSEQKVEMANLNYLKQLSDMRAEQPKDQAKMQKLEREKNDLTKRLEETEQKLQESMMKGTRITAEVETQNKMIEQRWQEVKQKEAQIAAAPPKILDPTIRASRDNALEDLRKCRMQLDTAKKEADATNQKLRVVEQVIDSLRGEKEALLLSHGEIKATLVDSLNQQETKHNTEILRREKRIKELEEKLMLFLDKEKNV